MNVVSFINQKGGTGKTTTCMNVGACLSSRGYKVLLIDTDPQGSLTTSAGIDTDDRPTLYEVLKGSADVNGVICVHNDYFVLPTDLRQSGAEMELVKEVGAEQLMRTNVIRRLKTDFDFILIDCPPTLSLFTVMALAASSGIVIPLQAQFLPFKGIVQLQNTVRLVQERINPDLAVLGYVFTQYDGRKNLDRQVYNKVDAENPGKVFSTTISVNVALAEAPAFGQDIFEYDPKSKGARQYDALTTEFLERIRSNG